MSSDVIKALSVKEINDLSRLNIQGEGSIWVANATNTVTISNVAPAAVGTATIAKWMKVNQGGTDYYIPMWT